MTAQKSETTKRAFKDPNSAGRGDTEPTGEALVQPGSVLAGKYRVEQELGRGGMGVVMTGHQLNLDRRVAIKFLRGSLATQARSSQRFAREAMAVAKIESEHVVRVFDAGEEAGVPYIVMEHLEGHDLAAELAKGPLPPAFAVQILRQACEPILEAHSLGIVHRDLKPSNLFLAKSKGKQSLKVLDFGVSKWLGPAPGGDTPFATREDSLIGTPAYVSPEQLVDPQSVDGRTDVWALGVVLYQCLTGRLPFRADSVPRLTAAILSVEPAAFEPGEGVPPSLQAITLRCLKKDPAERFQSLEELDRALAAFETTGGEAAPPAPSTRRPPVWMVVAGVAVILAAGYFVMRSDETPEDGAAELANPTPAAEATRANEPVAAEVPPPEPAEVEAAPAAAPVKEEGNAAAKPVESPARSPAPPRVTPKPRGQAPTTPHPAPPPAAAENTQSPAPAPSASAPPVKERLYRH